MRAVGPNRSLAIEGKIDRAGNAATFEGGGSASWAMSMLRAICPHARIDADGLLQISGVATWGSDGVNASTRVQLNHARSATQPASALPGTLHVDSGVFTFTTSSGDAQPLRVNIRDASFDIAGKPINVQGVEGTLAFSQFSPLSSPLDQSLVARKLVLGQVELTDGDTKFQVLAGNKIDVRRMHWQCLGGELLIDGMSIRGNAPSGFDVQLRDLDLSRALALLAQNKAAGAGKLTGVLPVNLSPSTVHFGEGRLTAQPGGSIQIKNQAAIAQAAREAARQATSPEEAAKIQQEVIDALGDFQFEQLSAQLAEEEGKLVGYIKMTGHGKAQANQPIDYELRVNGIDALLQSRLENPPPTTRPAR